MIRFLSMNIPSMRSRQALKFSSIAAPSIAAPSMAALSMAVLSMALLSMMALHSQAQISILEAEQQAFQNAGDFAATSVIQLEKFGASQGSNSGADATNAALITGTLVDPKGWIVSSQFHFRDQPASITANLPSGQRVAAKIVARDFSRELVLLKIEPPESLKAAQASEPKNWQVGQWVIALGKTFDPAIASRSVGILSAQGRIFDKAIQTDAKISPHNYGGPLVDLEGKVMGILTPMNPGIATEGEVQQWYDGGIGFAVPLKDILARLERMQQGKDIHSGKVGFRPKAPDDFGGPVVLAGVTPGSPAAKAGMRSGDKLVRVAGKEVPQLNRLRHALGPMDAETTVHIEFEREGKPMSVDCELVKEVPIYREPFLGLYLGNLKQPNSLVIQGIIPNSPAARAGLEIGDRILSLHGKEIEDANKLRESIAFLDYREAIPLKVKTAKEEKVFQISATPWSKEIPTDAGVANPNLDLPAEGRGIVDLPMGDVKNKAFVFTAANYNPQVAHGLMIVMPEAGEVDRKDWVDAWEPFCRDQRWILAVLSSADAKQWSLDESELIQRVRNLIANDYSVDPGKVVLGGVGAGGSLALLSGIEDRAKTRGIWMMDSRIPVAGRFPTAEPMESVHLLMIGSKPEYAKFLEAVQKIGFPGSLLSATIDLKKPNTGNHLAGLRRWLKSLEAL